jgi:hypothetical protein
VCSKLTGFLEDRELGLLACGGELPVKDILQEVEAATFVLLGHAR